MHKQCAALVHVPGGWVGTSVGADTLVTVVQVTDAAVREAQQQLAAKEAQLAGLQGTLRLLQELADQRGQQVEALEQALEQQEEQHQQHLMQQRQQHERDLAQVCGPALTSVSCQSCQWHLRCTSV